MSRIAAYLGPMTRVSSLIEQGDRSFLQQSTDAPDGFGIGWYPGDGQPEPLRLIDRGSLWTAAHHLKIARRSFSTCVIAGARRVNAGDSAELSGVQPLEHGRHLFAFAGKLQSFHEVFARPLEKALGDEAARTLRGTSEAELLFATWIDALGNRSGEDAMADALDRMVTRVRQIGGKSARAALAVICSDGHSLVTLRTATLGAPPPLVTTVAGDGAPVPRTGRLIAAEPLYGSGWSEVEPHSLTIFAVEG